MAQTDSTVRKKFSIGFSTSYGFGYRKLSQNKNSKDINLPIVIKANNENEVKGVYQSIGINFNYYFKNRISLGFDVNYNTFNYNTKMSYFSSPIYDPTLPEKAQTYYSYGTIELPLYIGYSYKIKKFDIFANLGIGTHYLYQASSTLKSWYADGTITSKTIDKGYLTYFNNNRNEFFLSVNSKIGVAYNPIKLLSIRLSPELKYGITPIANTPILSKLIGYGFNLSINICL